MSEREDLHRLVRDLRALVSAGGRLRLTPARGTPRVSHPAPAPSSLDGFPDDPTLSPDRRLELLRAHIGDCRRCPLGAGRIRLVFGVGNPAARVVFVGEGPGYAEDRAGEPFVGPAGQLLDKILHATNLSRTPVTPASNWVYIANTVKCHPMIDPTDNAKRGNDRPPSEEEMATCSPFLLAQLRVIRPRFIVALGGTAGKALLKTSEGISRFRGRWVDFRPDGWTGDPARLMATYHPAALLRNPSLKKVVWEDMKNLRSALDASETAPES